MNSNFRDTIESLSHVAKINDDIHFDTVQLELNQRTFEIELATKRKQVNQLREEVDSQNQVNHDLRRDLDLANAKILNLEAEIRAWKQNSENVEGDSKNRFLIDKKFQYEATVNENASLKELLQKSIIEKRKLERQVEDLTSQHTLHAANMKELLQQDQKIRNMIDTYATTFDEMDKLKDKVLEMYNNLGDLRNQQQQINLLKEKIEVTNSTNKELEEQLVFVKAKLTMFEDLLQNYSLPKPNDHATLQDYYLERTEELERQLKVERELIMKHQERLQNEVSANIYLTSKLGDLDKKIEELEKKMVDINVNDNSFRNCQSV